MSFFCHGPVQPCNNAHYFTTEVITEVRAKNVGGMLTLLVPTPPLPLCPSPYQLTILYLTFNRAGCFWWRLSLLQPNSYGLTPLFFLQTIFFVFIIFMNKSFPSICQYIVLMTVSYVMFTVFYSFSGLSVCHPRIVVIGALGRCGKGALDMALKAGIPRSTQATVYITN